MPNHRSRRTARPAPSDAADEARAPPCAAAAFPIVGIGASAGGLEAFSELLKHLPSDTGMAFVLVQHLDPQHPSALAQLLARATALPVQEITQELRVEPDHVYVIAPDTALGIEGGVLKPHARASGRAPNRSVDVFFEALAADQHERAIGVILSGAASDGTLGLEAIKAEGGITFAQDDSAGYDSMPHSAVAAGCVDFVLAPQHIAAELARIARHPYVTGAAVAEAAPAGGASSPEDDHASAVEHQDDATPLPSGGSGAPDSGSRRARAEAAQGHGGAGFQKILLLLRNHCGVDFSLYKSSTIQRRITRRMLLGKLDTPEHYARFLRGNAKELDALYSDVLISVTSFFRNPEAFEALQREVFPKLLAQGGDEPVRVWVLGCSTGQEAYSLAMAFTEAAEQAPRARALQIFATDLNDALLDKARHGLYAKSLAADLSPERLRRFFVEEDGGWRISKRLREMVVFARQNLISDPPFSRMDLITCRNLLIYLEAGLQKKIVPVFHYALKPHGTLWLGASESIGGFTDLFEPLDRKHRIYSKKVAATPVLALPVARQRGEQEALGQAQRAATALRVSAAQAQAQEWFRAELNAQREADRIVISQFAPPSVLINDALQVLQFRGATSAYLEPPSGKASFDVLKMARKGLTLPLRTVIAQARKENKTARKDRVRFEYDGHARMANIEVVPLKNLRERCFLVLFESADGAVGRGEAAAEPPPAPPARKRAAPQAAEQRRLADLEAELDETLQYVQSVQEQYESANEELQAASEEVQSSNEELQSLNEELTTSKEELESSNEELTTLNEEMANRNAELNRLNSDLVNFQTSAQLVIVLLARDLTIRRFSAQAEKQFNLQASDVGRPIGQIRHGLELPELEHLITEVIDSVRAQERELRSRDGRWFSLRVRPYLTLDNQVDGAVLVLLDIDAIKRGEEALADSEARLHAMFEATSVGISESDAETSQLLRVNERLARITGYGADELLGKTLLELTHPDDRPADMQGHARLLRGEGTSYAVEKRLLRKDGASVWVHVTVNLVQPTAGRPLRTVAITLDIGERQQAQQALAHLGAIVTSSDDAIIGKDMNGVIRSWNRGAERLFGYTAAEAIGQPVTLLIPADRANEEPGILERIRHGETIDHYETVRQRKDGSLRDISLTVSPIRDAAGHVIGAAKIARDITESKQAERAMRESHVRFEALFDASPIGMYLVDADLRILLVSPSARPVFGDIGELIGRDLVEIIHNLWPKAYADEIVRRFRHTLETGEPYAAPERIEQRLDRGVIEVYQWQINRIALAQSGYGVVCYFQDISAQVQSRAAIAASAQRLRFVMDSAPQKIFTAMPNGDFDYLSPQWVGFTGLTLEQLKDSGWTQCIHPDDVSENIRVWQHAVDTAEPFQFEHRLRRADGEYRWHISRAVAMRGDEGQVVMWVGSNTDIHEQLQAQNQLRQFASDLSEADHRKDEFLAMLAHELRNPLAPILNAVEILRLAGVETSRPAQTAVPDGREPRSLDTDGAARSALQIVERQARQMVRLVDDLLDVSRISRGKIELRRTTVDLSSLMQQVADGAHPITDSLRHELTIALPREPVLLDADPTRLAQLIGNLIHNACKFTERGGRIGVTVQVEGEAAVPPGAPRRQLVVRVRDNGIGIAADQLERIFQMFTQVDASLARSSGGLGIGLALVKKLVELHGGTVAVHSAGIGQGSEFVVRLPIVIDATADEPAQPNVAAESAAAPSALRILVVDDNHDAAESLATILQLDGHETRLAHDGLEAVETAAKFRPDVIFLDIGLPKLDGYEAGRRIRAQIGVGEKRPLLVALSGWGQDEHRRRSAQAGFDAHLVKPVQPEALMKLLA